MSVASGFSHSTGVSAAMQASTCSACRGSGEAITTASTSAESISSSAEPTATASAAAATCSARALSAS